MYTKYGQIAFFLSYLFPPEASYLVVKHLKQFDYELSRVFYAKNCNLSKYIPYQYILSSTLHCRLSSCPPNVIYTSIYKNRHHRTLMSELNSVFSRNFENTTKMLIYICNSQRIFDFYGGTPRSSYSDITLLQPYAYRSSGIRLIIDSYNYHQYSDVLSYETKSSRKNKYFVKDDHYYCNLKYREYDYPKKITNKQFKQSIQKNHYKKNKLKTGFRRNY